MVCERDREGIVAKLAAGSYDPANTIWVKIKNPAYSQAAGAEGLFRSPEKVTPLPSGSRTLPVTAFFFGTPIAAGSPTRNVLFLAQREGRLG
jgi:hypothetical protein